MATLYVTEYTGIYRERGGGGIQAASGKVAGQTVAIGGSSTQSSAFNSATRLIRVHTDAICSIAIGANPTASATTERLAANSTEYFAVNGGDKIAVITNS